MQFTSIVKIVGLFSIMFSFSMLPPIVVNFIYHQNEAMTFLKTFLIVIGVGVLLWYPVHRKKIEMKVRDAFLIVVLFWLVLSIYGALPFILSPYLHQSFTNAFFESTSGLTTSGATVLHHIDFMPNAIRFYRQEIQFIGGMGIIVLAIAIFPMLGIGGMQLFRAEMPGPMKDAKLKPRIQETAKSLWLIYVFLTVACMLSYWACGMSFFDAMGESFSTISTGGFAMHDASFGYYGKNSIQLVGALFMILASINFALHYTAVRHRTLFCYFRDIEFKAYIVMLTFITLVAFTTLVFNRYYNNDWDTFVDSLFDVVSLASTTGFTSASFSHWPAFLPILMLMGGVIGGCAASTCGGMKMVRFILLYLQGIREIKRLVHPNAKFAIKFGETALPDHVIDAIWGFIAFFTAIFVVIVLLLMAAGLDLATAFGATVASLANVGAGIAGVADNFAQIGSASKWILIAAMFLGRLEIFTILVLFSPSFWKQ
jgi:trk system potassium uptake protein TrkH